MSLAPASSRGAFLKARFAVNGIQCAARSLGTLTAAGRGLLSSMAGLFFQKSGGWLRKYQLRHRTGTLEPAIFVVCGRFRDDRGSRPRSQIASADPENFAFGILGFEPKQRQLRKCGLDCGAATADLTQQPAMRS